MFTVDLSRGRAEGRAETRTEGAVGAQAARAEKHAVGGAAGVSRAKDGVGAEAKSGVEAGAEALVESGAEAIWERSGRCRKKFPWDTSSSRKEEAGITRDEGRFPSGQRLGS